MWMDHRRASHRSLWSEKMANQEHAYDPCAGANGTLPNIHCGVRRCRIGILCTVGVDGPSPTFPSCGTAEEDGEPGARIRSMCWSQWNAPQHSLWREKMSNREHMYGRCGWTIGELPIVRYGVRRWRTRSTHTIHVLEPMERSPTFTVA